jgi:DNA modification methylase
VTGNVLYYGDNLDVLRKHVASESVDLVYLDPPFNSNRSYNVLFKTKSGDAAQAQIEAFDDTWTWSQQAESQFDSLVQGGAPVRVADALEAMRRLLGDNDVLAYLVMMTARLQELHRVLKPTGSLYLHCDPTASHYLKLILDAIFGPDKFRSEIVWKRYGAHNDAKGYGAVHDIILYFGKSRDVLFNKQFQGYEPEYVEQRFRFADPDGRRWSEQNLSSPNPRPNLTYPYKAKNGVTYDPPANGWKYTPERMAALDSENRLHYPKKIGGRLRLKNYLDELEGVPVQDLWTDIGPIGGTSAERMGYPTQKPLALLERIISTSTNPGDLVLDPFCGCGTTIDAAQKLGRSWVGIDITYLAIDLIDKRLRHTYGEDIVGTYKISGIPHDLDGAQALFDANPFDFERWAVSLVDAQANEKQVGDKGIDGVIRFPADHEGGTARALVSVKGGRQINPGMVRDLVGTVQQQKAEMGVFICMTPPTAGILEVVRKSGTYTWPISGRSYPKVQVLTVAQLLEGIRPQMPTPFLPYIQARRLVPEHPSLF